MKNVLKIDFFLSLFFMSVVFSYIFFQVQNLEFALSFVKYSFILLVTFLFTLSFSRDNLTKRKLTLFLPAIVFIIVYLLTSLELLNFAALTGVITQACYFMLVYFVAIIQWEKYQLKMISTLSIIVFLTLSTLIVTLVQTGHYEHINPNTLGAYTLFLAFFPLVYLIESNKKLKAARFIGILTICLIAIYFSLSRSIFLSVAVAFGTFLCWKIITKNKFFFKLYFVLMALIIFFITVLYPKMYLWDNFQILENLSLEYTGKSLMSGRGLLWESLLDVIILKPLFGHGAGMNLGSFLDTNLSPHNLYLQIGMQAGIVGIILFVLFLYFIWKSFWVFRNDKRVILSACFFVAILFHQTFEVSLVQINFGIGLIQWLIIGFALNFSINRHKTTLK